MNKKREGFTLVELIVGVTISLILMVSVSIFVSGGIKKILVQKQFLDSQSNEMTFLNTLTQEIQGVDTSLSYTDSSGILLHTSYKPGSSPWFSLVKEDKTNFFCDSGSLFPTTSHVTFSQILPFEAFGSDASLGKSQDESNLQIFPYKNQIVYNGSTLTGEYIAPTTGTLTGTTLYISDALGQSIYKFNTATPGVPGMRIIGQNSFGNAGVETGNPLDTYLNFPTGLAWGENSLFIADTNNNRILRYDGVTQKIEEFLNEKDGLNEPTGLYYNAVRKSLFIVNSGNGEILEYASLSGSTIPNLDMVFAPGTMNGVTELKVSFLTTNSGITVTPSFSGVTTTEDYSTGGTDVFDYYISDFSQVETNTGDIPMVGCTANTQKILEGNIPKKIVTTCSGANTGSTVKYFGGNSLSFSQGTQYGMTLQNITGDFSKNKSYAVKLTLYASGNEVWENYYPFFTHGDNQILTQNDNRLRKVKTGLSYPTGIYESGGNYFVYDFLERKKVEFDIGGNTILSTSTQPFNFSLLPPYFAQEIFPYPISDFQFQFNGNLLQVLLKYYKSYACYSEEKRGEKTILWKKYVGN